MTDITPFLDAEFTEIGLAASACPQFAEQLIEALRRLPQTRAAESDVGQKHGAVSVTSAWLKALAN